MSNAGIPIYAVQGKDGGIAILDSFTLDKSMLTEIEKEQILTALEALIAADEKTTDELLIKLKTLFQIHTANWIEVDFSDWFQEKPTQNIFNDIKKAILDRYVISFEYFNHQGSHVFRHIQPLKLLFKGKAWYVYGFCLLRNEYRFFKLSRIKNLNITEKKFLPKEHIAALDDFITKDIVFDAFEQVKIKKPNKLYEQILFNTMQDRTSIEILHIGSYDDEPISFPKMYFALLR